jgi:hypothetical protein
VELERQRQLILMCQCRVNLKGTASVVEQGLFVDFKAWRAETHCRHVVGTGHHSKLRHSWCYEQWK